MALEKVARQPLFFEIHRLSVFSPRSLDVDVVLDLMIHDIDILLSLVHAEIEEIRAAGISILTSKVDIANVRLQFQGGCVANLTASRVSTDRVRKLRLFQPHQYISVDYGRQDAAVFSVGADRQISFEQLPVTKAEPLALQFEAFLDSIETRQTPKLSGHAGRLSLGGRFSHYLLRLKSTREWSLNPWCLDGSRRTASKHRGSRLLLNWDTEGDRARYSPRRHDSQLPCTP